MKRIFNYLNEKEKFSNHYKNLVKEIKVITNIPSDKVTEETIKDAISLLYKCEESIERMDKLIKEMNKLEKLILKETIVNVQLKKDCYEIRKNTIIIIEETMIKP